MLYRWIRPLLFRIDPERAHGLALGWLRVAGTLPPIAAAVRRALRVPAGRPATALGLRLANPLGLAAGYDKDGVAWRGLASLGFGHVEIGTVTPRPQPGNPRPRVFRLPRERSLINRLGFPSRGAEFVARRLRSRPAGGPVVGVNLGKQRETPLERAADDYEALVSRFAPLADYLAVNISSPNTPELRRLQHGAWLAPLLRRVVAARDAACDRLGRAVPLLVKLSPDLEPDDLRQAVEALLAAGIDGVIAGNTTTHRDGVAAPEAAERGGLSGGALTARSTDLVRRVHELAGDGLTVVGCGGVLDARDARDKLDAGARLVQLYTGLVYGGPGLVGAILRSL